MMVQSLDAEFRVLSDGETAEPDLYLGADDFHNQSAPASAGDGLRAEGGGGELAAMVRNPGMSLAQAAFISSPAVYGYSLGVNPGQRILYAGLGAAIGAALYEYVSEQGWVE